MLDIQQLRVEYRSKSLDFLNLHTSPFVQFQTWFEEARKSQILEPNAMILATASLQARPSSRTVLLKNLDEKGLLFFTSYESRKARELEQNPFASVTFLWKELERQVIIEGKVEKSTLEQSHSYFSQRPRGSQMAVWASHQGQVIPSRTALEEEYQHVIQKYEGQSIPTPPYWGGFYLVPNRFEFWQGRENRLHDRFQYILDTETWHIDRLSP